ncbi:hypothetical protein FH965_13350 [Streptomyces spectabilis]|uniref:Smf/DprA SLOG domain-containing protein n=2 Tax=Streptomyces spectabilis TaxID=68270 RepID=A0A516RKV5_STRST|nr:hypothetical protein FH965_13350 [Streptomyces spectabilis]
MCGVAVTGTRNTEHRGLVEYTDLFRDYLGPFASPGAHFYVGGAKGIDSMALVWLADHTSAAITVVVPGRLDQQPVEAQQAIARTRDRIEEIVELRAPELKTPAFHARNRWMVDHAHMTIGYPRRAEESSGTWQTLNYTRDQGKPSLIVPV